MKREVELYINDYPVDLSDESFILMNYTEDEADSPTAVINSFSKQITLPLTDNNAKAFENMDIANRITPGNTFNPITKTPFMLLIGGELFESGYCRLDEVTKEDGYKLTLFGGLGSFMYSLTYFDGNTMGANRDNTKTLADLTFMSDSPNEKEFDFVINAQTVRNAWNNIGSGMWKYISFAPMYNGYPKAADFVADKGIIQLGQAGLPETVEGYSGKGNYALVNFTHDFTEWEMRDFRSYLQRPVLSIKGFMEAIARAVNNGSWAVDYAAIESSSEFQKGWISLPMIGADTPMKTENIRVTTSSTDAPEGVARLNITPQGVELKDGKVVANVSVLPKISGATFPDTPATSSQNLFFKDLGTTLWPGCSGLFIQLVACDANGNVLQGSDIAYIYDPMGAVGREYSLNGSDFASKVGFTKPEDYGFAPANFVSIDANLRPSGSTGSYELSKVLNFTLACNGAKSFRVVAIAATVPGGWFQQGYLGPRKFWYLNQSLNYTQGSFTGMSMAIQGNVEISYEESDALHSNSTITKRNLLGGMPSPGAMLTALARVCGWKFLCDNTARKITIMPRSNYYNGGTIDINERIDRSKSYTIVPNSFASKYLEFGLETYKGSFAEMYSGKYGRAYGSMRVNTGYDFNEDHLEMFDGIALKHAATVQEFSPYFYTVKEKNDYKPAAFRDTGNTYTLWDAQDGTSKDFDLPSLGDAAVLSALASTEIQTQAGDAKGFDDWFRVQMENNGQPVDDGSGVLLYFQGMVNTCGQLSDDDSTMLAMLGGKVCWKPFFGDGQITVPSFTTYLWSEGFGGDIILSSDIAQPRELGMPGMNYKEGATLYERYWKKYVEDRYSVDAKVCRCYVRLDGLQAQVGNELLRYFFWFDECLWSLNKIIDYSANTDDPCLCEFIRVQDPSAYTEFVTPPAYLTANPSSLHFEANGGTKKFYISTNLQTQWNITAPSGVSVLPRTGIGDKEITVTVGRSGGFVQPATIVIRDALNQLTANVTVTQDEYYLRVKNITPWPIRIPAKGGTVEFDIESNDEWSVIENGGDTLVITPEAGSGYAHVVITVPENPTLEARTFEAIVSGRYGSYADIPIRIIQDRYQFNVRPRTVNMPQSGGTFYLEIETLGTDTPWALVLPEGVIANETTGRGDARLTITVAENPTVASEDPDFPDMMVCDERELKIKVKFTPVSNWYDQENPHPEPGDPDYDPDHDYDDDNPAIIPVIVTQAGLPRLIVTPPTLQFPWEGGEGTVYVRANEAVTYGAPTWITIEDVTPVPDPDDPDYDPDAYYNPYDKVLKLTIAENSILNDRVAVVTFESDSGLTATVLVSQNAKVPALSVSPANLNFGANGGSATVTVTANESFNWGNLPAWLTITDITPAPGPDDPVSYNKTLRVTASANNSSNTRVHSIVFTSVSGLTANVLVSEDGAIAPTLAIFPQAVTFDPAGESVEVQVFSNEEWTLTVPAWLSASVLSGTGNATIQLTAAANETGIARTGSVDVSSTSQLSASCAVSQDALPARFLTFESTGGNTIRMDYTYGNVNMEISTDGETWTVWDFTDVNIPDGGRLYVRGTNPNGIGTVSGYSPRFVIGGSGTVACSGNIMHLIDYTQDLLEAPYWAFRQLFMYCDKLVQAPTLPATLLHDACYQAMFAATGINQAPALPAINMAPDCYSNMFSGCASLSLPPALSHVTALAARCFQNMFTGCTSLISISTAAKNIQAAPYCYASMYSGCTHLTNLGVQKVSFSLAAANCCDRMFQNCTGLTAAPPLPCTSMDVECYSNMFNGCTALVSAPMQSSILLHPILPATTLAYRCYQFMFYGCISLVNAPELPAQTMAQECYAGMFGDCTSLQTAPLLPGSSLAQSCYSQMFVNCTSLTSAPVLSATSLAQSCYEGMFTGCTSLQTPPALPATLLATACYRSMFSNSGITTAPSLPATTLVTNCYQGMFYGCSALNYIKALFTTTPNSMYLDSWVFGVAGTGTFVMSAAATWDPNNYRGDDGVPYGWTVLTE